MKSSEQIKQFGIINTVNNTVSYLVPISSVYELVELGIEGLNSKCCDDFVEGGHLFNDITYTFEVEQSNIFIRVVVNDASEWIGEFICK